MKNTVFCSKLLILISWDAENHSKLVNWCTIRTKVAFDDHPDYIEFRFLSNIVNLS